MPKFMKQPAIELIDSSIETYSLALHGLVMPAVRRYKQMNARYAPVVGLFGASVELLLKACLVQAKGINSMYKNNNVSEGYFKEGTYILKELKKEIKAENPCVDFMWVEKTDREEQKSKYMYYFNKFGLYFDLRAKGLHAGVGCSRDIAFVIANDVYDFIVLLSKCKKLKAYLKNIPAPDPLIKDREAIIEDLSRRLKSNQTNNSSIGLLKNMYIVLPYIPEIKPDWLDVFEKVSVSPPSKEDVNYLVNTLSEAHSISLLKARGGGEGVAVKIEPSNPDALPIAIQNIKRELSSIPDQFSNDILTANTWLKKNRLALPLEDFLVDLFGLNLVNAKIVEEGKYLTAQQIWPFVASAYSTAGTPRPCWEFISRCDEIDKLIWYLEEIKPISNGYYRRRMDSLIKAIKSFKENKTVTFKNEKDDIFDEIEPYINEHRFSTAINELTPQFIRKVTPSEKVSSLLSEFMIGNTSIGKTLEKILQLERLTPEDKHISNILLKSCINYENRDGIIAVYCSSEMRSHMSGARKQMFFVDWKMFGPIIES